MDSEKLLDLYHEHYKDTYELSKEAQKRRNKSFVILCILEAISFMLFYNPDLICSLLKDAIRGKIESAIIISNTVLQTLVWILIAYIFVRYVQDVLYVERQYLYIDSLEKKITNVIGNDSVFNREGEHYLKDYPIVLNLIDLFYKMFCPILFAVVNIAHIVKEWQNNTRTLPLIIDSLICLFVIIITGFYYFGIHKKTTQWCKKHIPGVKWISDKLHKMFKGV